MVKLEISCVSSPIRWVLCQSVRATVGEGTFLLFPSWNGWWQGFHPTHWGPFVVILGYLTGAISARSRQTTSHLQTHIRIPLDNTLWHVHCHVNQTSLRVLVERNVCVFLTYFFICCFQYNHLSYHWLFCALMDCCHFQCRMVNENSFLWVRKLVQISRTLNWEFLMVCHIKHIGRFNSILDVISNDKSYLYSLTSQLYIIYIVY